jgi:hypothetical protein
MSRGKGGRGFTTKHRQVLELTDRVCSIDGCDAPAQESMTIEAPGQCTRYYGCTEHIGLMREALAQALREVGDQ